MDRTELRSREQGAQPAAVVEDSLQAGQLHEDPLHEDPLHEGPLHEGPLHAGQEVWGSSWVGPAMAAAPRAGSSALEGALPPVAPKPLAPVPQQPVSQQPVSQPAARHLLDCRVSVIPRLPVVNLEKPSSDWPDLTPSPVPRVSLVPPTGRLEPSQLRSAAEARSVPTVAPRTRAHTPALTVPRLSKPAQKGWLSRRIARDLRSSKREIAFGLGIGIGLSFVLGKLGQTYLESSAARARAIESWTASAQPSPEPRAPVANGGLPATLPPTAAAPSSAGSPAAPALVAGAAAAAPAAALLAAPAAAFALAPAAVTPAAVLASIPSAVAAQLSATPSGGARRQARPPLPRPRATQAPRRPAAASSSSDTEPSAPDESPTHELAPRGKVPLSPSESAGLGRELPL